MKEYLDAKCNVFTEHMTVPEELQGEYEQLCQDIYSLGDKCGEDYNKFEEQFVSTGLSERYNGLLVKCKPKAVKMTREQKKTSLKGYAKAFTPKNIAREAAGMAVTELQEEAIAMNRERMIEDEVFDDYTRARNSAEAAVSTGKFIFDRFKKRK
ncbi:MAG: hypothetical protein ACI4KL_03790 [Lentihominibacter sp.]